MGNQEDSSDYLSLENQLAILKKVCTDLEFFRLVHHQIVIDDFADEVQPFVDLMLSYLKEYPNDAPNIGTLRQYLISDGLYTGKYKVDQVKPIIEDVRKVELDGVDNKEFWLDNLANFIKKSRLLKMLYEGVDYIDSNKTSEKKYQYFYNTMTDIVNLNFEEETIHDYRKDMAERIKWFNQLDNEQIPTNIPILKKLGFGEYGSLSLFLGETNIGKCWVGETVLSVYVKDDEVKLGLEKFLEERRNVSS